VSNGREAALQALFRVEKGSYTNLALKQVFRSTSLELRERSLAAEITYGVVRRLNTLDWMLGQVLHCPLPSLTPWIRGILRSGAYQLFYLDRVPAAAAVDQCVNLARVYGHQGTAGLVNGVLRNLIRKADKLRWPDQERDPVNYFSLTTSHPAWLLRRWSKNFGWKETRRIAEANNQPAAITLRVNPLKTSKEALKDELLSLGVEVEDGLVPEAISLPAGGAPSELQPFREGRFSIQGEASMLAVKLLDPRPGEKILDLCSAPGGKSTHSAELMRDQGEVWACDLRAQRLQLVKNSFRRLGLSCLHPTLWDGRLAAVKIAGFMDRVLLDAPCTGLGVIRRKPDLKWRRKEADILNLSRLQQELVASAATAVKPGGILVYSVCSFEPEETEEVISRFLKSNSGFTPEPVEKILSRTGVKVTGANYGGYLFPHRHRLDGFYLCRMKKSL